MVVVFQKICSIIILWSGSKILGFSCLIFARRRSGITFEDGIENIDIGGPTLIRAAAKESENYSEFVLLVEASLVDDVACTEIGLFLIPDNSPNFCISMWKSPTDCRSG